MEQTDKLDEDFENIQGLLSYRARGRRDLRPEDEYKKMLIDVEGD